MSEYIVDVGSADAEHIAYFGMQATTVFGHPIGERVVRCRDCRHYTEDEMEYYHYCGSWCEQVEPDGFCAWGERRDA